MSRRQMMTATTKVIAVALNYHKLHYIHSPSERMKACYSNAELHQAEYVAKSYEKDVT